MQTIKKGYKQTEIGVIPEDWEINSFGNLGVFYKGKGIKKDEVITEGKPCVRYGELYTIYDNVINETVSHIGSETAKKSFKLNYGDLLFAGSGETKTEIGKSAVILKGDTYAGGDIVIFRAKNIDSVFLGYISNSQFVKIQKSVAGQGDTVVHIYSSGISKIKIPLPPLPEQKAIAEVLTHTDNLIETLQQKINKKQAIKKGAMQQLLAPKPHWETKKLGEIFNITAGGDLRKSEFSQIKSSSHKYPIFSNAHTKKGLYGFSNSFDYEGDCLTISARGGIGFTLFRAGKFVAIGRLLVLKPIVKMNCKFMEGFINLHIEFSSESTGVPQLTAPQVSKYSVALPSIVEQTHIATILSDMDTEIEKLEQQHTKYQKIKQGLMQNLLTGKIRLV